MKVALVGNMNNNNFAMLRYLRDLGVDAHLLLFDNEIHPFSPESDTWQIEKWRPYIHSLPFGNNPRHLMLKSASLIRGAFASYPFSIGSGLSPALFGKAGLILSIFYPYSIGIEWVGVLSSDGRPLSLTHLFHCWVRGRQIKGLRHNTVHCTCLENLCEITEKSFAKLGVRPIPLGIPLVYDRERVALDAISAELRRYKALMEGSDLVVFSHARHYWCRRPEDPWSMRMGFLKRNDLLIRAFAEYLKLTRRSNPLLVLLTYGSDVDDSRRLIAELGIASSVLWLPTMPRRNFAYLMEAADFVVGEFNTEGAWGGTAWEGLAAGRPVFQAVNFMGRCLSAAGGLRFTTVSTCGA